MRRKIDKPGMMTAALRRAIAESGIPYLGLEQRTGIKRQSLMAFRDGKTIRLDNADVLAAFFGFKVIVPRRPARKGGKDKAYGKH